MPDLDIYQELAFPLEGVDRTRSYQRQRPGTCIDALNVRSFDPLTGRARGSSRPGIVKAMPTQPIGTFPIQDLNFIVTDASAAGTLLIGQFVYALASGSGFGIGKGADGTSLGTGGVASGFAMSCSCWDTVGNAYIAMTNTTTGAVTIFKATSTGTVTVFNTGSLTVTTGSLRNVAGMVVIGAYLFVARTLGGVSAISRLVLASGATDNLGWYAPGVLLWSTNSVNCLGAIGNTIGWESAHSTTPQFVQCNSQASTAGNFSICTYTGTAADAFSSVCSDGTGFFYTIASVTTNQIRQIAIGANTSNAYVWANALPGGATAHALCYNTTPAMLVAVGTGGTYGVQSLNLSSGAVLLGNSGLGTSWATVDCDGQGNFTLYLNGQASNDIIGVNQTFSTVWGPSSFANTTHYGASVNKTSTQQTTGLSTRQISMTGVSNGEIFRFDSTQKYTLTGGPGALSTMAPIVFSSQNGTKLFFVDGANYKAYNPVTGIVSTWTLTAGTLPRDANNNGCRLIETWNGRTVLSGLLGDSQNWFMSAVSNPLDFNTGVFPATQTMAVFGNLSPLGLLGAPVQCMIPYVDNTMLFGLSHQIWLLQGDPQAGGSFVMVTDKIGMPFGRPWCKDPNGQVYFLSSRNGVFKITPGALPVRVSQQIEQLIENVNLSQTIVRMEWDTQAQGFGLWLTPLAGGATTNFFWEERTNAWWPDAYSNSGFNPNCVKAMDGDSPDQRTIFLGCQDGYIRSVNKTAILDDYLPIPSFIVMGPITTRDLDDVTLKALHARLAAASLPVTFSVYVGNTAEAAFSSQPVITGTWTPGHNPTNYIRWSGVAVYIRIDCTGPWAAEVIQAVYKKNGLVRRRA